mgnify:CR=1 FL=1
MPADQRWDRLLDSLNVKRPEAGIRDQYTATHLLAFDIENDNSIVSARFAPIEENCSQEAARKRCV